MRKIEHMNNFFELHSEFLVLITLVGTDLKYSKPQNIFFRNKSCFTLGFLGKQAMDQSSLEFS